MAAWRKAGEIMAFRENELAAVEKSLYAFLQRKRPPEHIRSKVDIGFKISGQSIELIEIRPRWDKPSVYEQHSFARTTFIRTQNIWKLFWLRANMKWHPYTPRLFTSLDDVLTAIEQDEYGCFFG
jgi:hypothetical protein